MKCPTCGEETLHSGTMSSLVGHQAEFINGELHTHDDNCLVREYVCINEHVWNESLRRSCTLCDWKGKTHCNCHSGEKILMWTDSETYLTPEMELLLKRNK